MTHTQTEKLLLTAKETARQLSISEKTLWTYTNRGDIPVVRIGRKVCYDPADLRAWIESKKTRAVVQA